MSCVEPLSQWLAPFQPLGSSTGVHCSLLLLCGVWALVAVKCVDGCAGEGCSAEGGCASCPYMKMNSLQALLSVCSKVGSPGGEALLEGNKPKAYTEAIGGRSVAKVCHLCCTVEPTNGDTQYLIDCRGCTISEHCSGLNQRLQSQETETVYVPKCLRCDIKSFRCSDFAWISYATTTAS